MSSQQAIHRTSTIQATSLPALLLERATHTPDEIFLQDVRGDFCTYEQLHHASLKWANALHARGVQQGETIAVMMHNCLEQIEAWLGISWLRAREVPINTAYRGHMLQYVLNNSQAKGIVIAERYLDVLAEVAPELRCLQFIIVPDMEKAQNMQDIEEKLPFKLFTGEIVSEAAILQRFEPPQRHDIASIVYTSGTTGPSKGVLIPWGQFMTSAENRASVEGVPPKDAFYSFFPFFHVSGKAFLCIQAQLAGRLVFREKLSMTEFWSDIKRFGCTSTGVIAAVAQWLLSQEPQPDDADNPLQNVVLIPIIPNFAAFQQRFGILRISTNFGMTEVGGILNTEWNPTNIKSSGRVEPGYEVRVVDEHDYEVGPHEVGELIVRSARPWSLMIGYFGMPEKTAEAWRNGWFHTGDSFTYNEEGNFYFVDRKKDALRRRGENISSFEVEAIVNQHPAVVESAAIAVPVGQHEDEVKIVVVCKPDCAVTPDELLNFLVPKLPNFMLPRYVEFVDALPKTPVGKVRKVDLRLHSLNEHTWDRLASSTRI